jgi:curved DNA-binding protein CbpA
VKAFQTQTWYELLEVSVGASTPEIRGAYERLIRLYGDDQVALYGLVEADQAGELRTRLLEAFEVLGDQARREAYDRSIGLPPQLPPAPLPRVAGPEVQATLAPPSAPAPVRIEAQVAVPPPGEPPTAPAPEPAAPPPPPAPAKVEVRVAPYEVPAGAEFNGALLRQVRLARGLSLQQISERTRISARHLENLEADRYEALPAVVYLRGILVSVSRELKLDGQRVSASYLQFVDAHRLKG